MKDSTGDGTIGSRLRTARRERGLTQEALAERAEVGLGVISDLEQERRETARITTLTKLADALGVTLSALLDRRERMEREQPAGVLGVRDALLSISDLPGVDTAADDGTPTPLASLELSVRRGWELYWAGRLGDLAGMLPGLIGEARLTRGQSGPQAARPLAQAYQLAADLMVHVGSDDLAMVAAERALHAAANGDDELQHAILAGTASWVLLHQGRAGEAEQVARVAAEKIEPRMSSATPEHLTVWGSLLLSAAAPAATASRGADVESYIGLARSAAGRFEADRHDYWTSFGPTQVSMQACYANTVLGRPGRALKAAQGVRRKDLLGISWGAHHLDKAQALATDGRPGDNRRAVDALAVAHGVSPEWFRHQGLARSLTRELADRRTRLGEPLSTLMESIGARPSPR
jgi:transcriptional regulator with XRE-family HTH domain